MAEGLRVPQRLRDERQDRKDRHKKYSAGDHYFD